MSWDLSLTDPVSGDILVADSPHFMAGGTFAAGGTTELWLNVTYNYSAIFRRPDVLGDGCMDQFNGMTGLDSIPIFDKAINALGDDTDPDYWEPTEGNAKRSLISLRTMAKMRPDGVWLVE